MRKRYAWRNGKLVDITNEGVLIVGDLGAPSQQEKAFMEYAKIISENILDNYRVKRKPENEEKICLERR